MSVLNVTPEAHAAVKAAAELAGVSMGAWASERLLGAVPWTRPDHGADKDTLLHDPNDDLRRAINSLAATSAVRGETPAETLTAALDALGFPVAPDPSLAPWERK